MSSSECEDYPGREDPSYWSHLGNLGIRGIEFEKNRIQSERESLSAGTRALAFENYRTFIEASQCGRDVARHLNEVKVKLVSIFGLVIDVKFICRQSFILIRVCPKTCRS